MKKISKKIIMTSLSVLLSIALFCSFTQNGNASKSYNQNKYPQNTYSQKAYPKNRTITGTYTLKETGYDSFLYALMEAAKSNSTQEEYAFLQQILPFLKAYLKETFSLNVEFKKDGQVSAQYTDFMALEDMFKENSESNSELETVSGYYYIDGQGHLILSEDKDFTEPLDFGYFSNDYSTLLITNADLLNTSINIPLERI